MKSAKPLTRHDIENLTTRSARAWVRVRATVEENERLREVNAELLVALKPLALSACAHTPEILLGCECPSCVARGAIERARSAPLEQEVKP